MLTGEVGKKQLNAFKKQHGFTLVELLIVIIILGVLSAVVVPSVLGMFGRGGEYYIIGAQPPYEVYAEENGTPRLIGTIDLGELEIRAPAKMVVGDSRGVQLTIFPSEKMFDHTITGLTDTNYNVLSDTVELYSVMTAELKAVNFSISESKTSKAVSPISTTQWQWVISPNMAGEQLLLAEITTPLNVQGFENVVIKAVYNQSLNIHVVAHHTFDWKSFWSIFAAVLGGLAALIASVTGFIKYIWKPRKAKSAKQK